ncbi:hypothetical protein SAMN05421858_4140 [Haladaptatus litoreus]|uniref:Uncharacterized protein n=1 Tax=Haladaptatus litoreus TaxID=553468 RepID=A0A1N7E9M6_9EURY|nr:hypothetical protein [Haladaptatus litoreus]SIR84729.1 hypothetical protein SAMN05421858_4140 [Haladaptatus litoreus]
MMDDVDNLGFISMSVLGALMVSELVPPEIVLGLLILLGLASGFVRYRRGKKWLAFGWVLFSLSVSSLPFIESGPVVLVVFFGGVVVSMVILLFGQLGLIERLSLPPLRSKSS